MPPEVVWSLLSDVMVYPQGAVYWLEGSKRYGPRYPVSVEEILDVEPGKRLACTGRHPRPLGRIVGPDHHGPPGVPAALPVVLTGGFV